MPAAAAILLAAALSSAARGDDDSAVRLGLGLGWYQPGANETIVNGSWVVVPRVGYDFDRTFSLEGDLGYSQDVTSSVQRLYHVLTPRLNLLVHAPATGPVTFFGAAGPGLYWKKVKRDENSAIGLRDYDQPNATGYGQYKNPDTDFVLNIGPGARVAFGDSPASLRTDFRYMMSAGGTPADKDGDSTTLEPDRYDNWEWTISLAMALGPGQQDTDGDGYLDDEDGCIDEPEDFDEYRDADGCPDEDNDRDGIRDTVDRCPDEAEDLDGFRDQDGCPDNDNDNDGIADSRDRCPDEAGPADNGGCPQLDRDRDGLLDAVDACPDQPGPRDTDGCPDRDGDRVPDHRDQCPDEPADPRVDPRRSDGCPSRVVVTAEQIVILDRIYFDTNRDTIKRVSFAILDEVARVLISYPELRRVEIAGHTDSDGSDSANLDLSQRRAEAVRDYLVDRGVEPERLTPRGFGESVPIDTNATEDGKARNRRVEFNILP